MKRSCTILTALMVLCFAFSAFASNVQFSNKLQDVINDKDQNVIGNSPTPWEPLVGGETIATATTIPGLPYADAGSTAGHINDYDAVCPYTGSTSPDVVYKYTPAASGGIVIDLCNSAYDTKVYVYDNNTATLIACNDDYCNDPSGNPYRSFLPCVPTVVGHTYYIVVDGYFGDSGNYNLAVTSCSPPPPCTPSVCPPGARLENEPDCGDGYVDATNGGCNSTPNVFSNLNPPCGVVCGKAGDYIFQGLNYRDTDWYQLNLGSTTCAITACLCASFNSQLAIINGNIGCGAITLTCGSVFGAAGQSVCCGPINVSGLVWIFVADSDFIGWPCGSPYILTVTNSCCSTANEESSWGKVKGLYNN